MFHYVYRIVIQGWVVDDLNEARPIVDAGTRMLEAHAAAVVKHEEINFILKVVRLFGKYGATLPEICGIVDHNYILYIVIMIIYSL